MKILAISGSLRSKSYNSAIIRALKEIDENINIYNADEFIEDFSTIYKLIIESAKFNFGFFLKEKTADRSMCRRFAAVHFLLAALRIRPRITITKTMVIKNAKPIHSGHNTHHQDQSI